MLIIPAIKEKPKKNKEKSEKKRKVPKVGKAEKTVAKEENKGDSINNQVLAYMREVIMDSYQQNRPYSLLNIFDNLHGKIKKSLLQSSLDELVTLKELSAKDFGKTRIYIVNQAKMVQSEGAELQTLQEELAKHKGIFEEKNSEIKALTNKLKELNSQFTNEQYKAEIGNLEREINGLKTSLSKYKSPDFESVDAKEIEKLESEIAIISVNLH